MSETEKKKPLTWGDIKTAVNAMTDAQLKMQVMWGGEEKGGWVYGVEIFKEDQINPSGDVWEGKETILKELRDRRSETNPGSEDRLMLDGEIEDMESEPVIAVKGQAVLIVE